MTIHRTEPTAREQDVTDRVLASLAGAPSERYREVLQALVRAVHGFAREVRLTQAECGAARCARRTCTSWSPRRSTGRW
jgi:hypothetical protein